MSRRNAPSFRFQQAPKPAKRLFGGMVGIPPEEQPASSDLTPNPMESEALDEDSVRKKFGLSKPERKRTIPNSYRQMLNLDPQDIIAFFDTKIGERLEFTQVDAAIAPSTLERRIKRFQKIIGRSKEIIEGMSARIIKLRRGKDDPLLDDKAAREKYKRQENARIARSNAKLFRYRAALRSCEDYREKVWCWATKPIYFRDVVDDLMVFTTVTDVRWEETDKLFTSGLQTHTRVELLEYFRRGFMDLEAYRAIVSLGETALVELGETEAEQRSNWDNLRKWENAIIRKAVAHNIITPRRDLAELLGLGAILDEDDRAILADTTEDALAIKTGGACYGGRIRGEGYRYRSGKITRRGLSSFDKSQRAMSADDITSSYHDPGFGSLHEISDDVESYIPN